MIEIIKSNEDLRKLIDEILHILPQEIAMDTEFIRETTYWPDLCLIQMAFNQRRIIIDALEQLDLHLLIPVLIHKDICKVFHSCRQDIEIFVHQLGIAPQNLFDTQIASIFINLGEGIGYDRLIQQILNIKIDKSLQYTDWSKRPLSQEQCNYAIADVEHLLKVYHIIKKRLKSMGRLEWVFEEMQPYLKESFYQNDPQHAWRKVKAYGLTDTHMARLKPLAQWREEKAQEHNINKGQLFKDDTLVSLSKISPLSDVKLKQFLSKITTVISKLNLEEELHTLLQKPVHFESDLLLPPPPLTMPQALVHDYLKLFISQKTSQLGIPFKHLISKEVLYDLALGHPEALDRLPIWQQQILKEDLNLALNGKLGLILSENCLTTISVESK